MKKANRYLTITMAVLCIAGFGLAAQTPPGGAWISGPVQSVSADSVTVQGLSIAVEEDTSISALTPDGTFQSVGINQVLPGDPFHGKVTVVSGTPTLVNGVVGFPFFWHGVVTALSQDEEGNVLSIEVDGTVTIYASQAAIIGTEPGSEGDAGMNAPYETQRDDSEPFLLQVGSTVGVNGFARGGVFAATVINVAVADFSSKGTISQLYRNADGHVTGFELKRNDTVYLIKLTIFTRVMRGGHPLSPDKLRAGWNARVTGKKLADDSIVAYKVRVLR